MKSLLPSRVSRLNVLTTLCVLGVTTFSLPVMAVPKEVCVKTSTGDIACGTPVPKPSSNPKDSVLGYWSGSLTQTTAPKLWNAQMNVGQNRSGSGLVGRLSIQPLNTGQRVSVTAEIEGDISNQVFNLREVRIIEKDAPSSWYFCDNLRARLIMSSESGSDVLQGSWECFVSGQRFNGELRLERQ